MNFYPNESQSHVFLSIGLEAHNSIFKFLFSVFIRQALHEAEEKSLESRLNMTPKAADDFRWLCFDIASRRDEEKDKLDYLELGRKAIEYGKMWRVYRFSEFVSLIAVYLILKFKFYSLPMWVDVEVVVLGCFVGINLKKMLHEEFVNFLM